MNETTFSNEQIELDDLPQFDIIDYLPLERAHLTSNLIIVAIIGLIPITVLSIVGYFRVEERMIFVYIILGLIVLFSFFAIMTYLGYKHKGYAIREKDIAFKSGLIWRDKVALPFNRVQHCEINEGPIDRMFGLADLKIFTAGGSSSDLEIPGLLKASAEQLKHIIVQKTGVDEEE